MVIGESNVAIDPAIGGYGVADIYLGEFSPHPGHPDFRVTNTAAHADDEARFYDSDRPQAYVHARGG